MKKRPLFITFEGGEGCGKSTQLKLTADFLRKKNYNIVETREPGGTPTAEKIRELILHPIEGKLSKEAELLLFMAARAEHIDTVIAPAIKQNKIVLCDRFSDSTYAYQGVNGNLSFETMEILNSFATNEVAPDITILLDADTEKLLSRREARGTKDRYEAKDLAFHMEVRKIFHMLAEMNPHRIKIVNALQTPEAVQKDIQDILIKAGL